MGRPFDLPQVGNFASALILHFVKRPLMPVVGAIVLALLAALYLTNSNWFYTRPGGIDAYCYVGYGLYYNNPLYLTEYYKVSRVPWILYQLFFRGFLLPIPAEIVIHFSLYVAGSLFAYAACARLFSRSTGVIVALLTAASPLLHASGGADYHNAPSGPLFFATIVSILWCIGRDARSFLLPGLLFAILVHINTMYIFFAPLFGLLGAWLARTRGRDWRYIVQASLWVCVGTLLCTAALSLIAVAFGRSWSFFMPQIRYAAGMAADPDRNVWWKPWSMSWIARSNYLGPIFGAAAIAFLEAARILIWRRRQTPDMTAAIIHATYLLEVLIWIYWQTFGHNTALQPSYTAYPLYGPMFLSIAAWLSVRVGDIKPTSLIGATVAIAALLYASLIGSSIVIIATHALPVIAPLWPAAALIILYLGLSVANNRAVVLPLVIVLLPIMNALTVQRSRSRDYRPTHCSINKQTYDYVVSNSVTLSRTVAQPEHIYVWYQEDEPIETGNCTENIMTWMIGRSFTAIGHSYVDTPKPLKPVEQLSAERLKRIGDQNAVVVAITGDDNMAQALAKRFEAEGVALRYDGRLLPPLGQYLPPFHVFRTVKAKSK